MILNIQPYIHSIQSLNPLAQRIYFNSALWKDRFDNHLISENINFITNNYLKSISRQDIISYFSQDDCNLLNGFLMTMIWGNGYPKNGRGDNRGPWRVSQMFENTEQSVQILKDAKKYIDNRNIIGAHKTFKDMQSCGVSFFSKFLYFLGKANGMKNYPLIFDKRVATTIGILTSTDEQLTSSLNIQPKQDPISYANYVTRIHEIALQNKIDADKIEFFLFNGVLFA